jgi:hypothetical protein
LEIPMYQLFYDGEKPPELKNFAKGISSNETAWGRSGKDAQFLARFVRILSKMDENNRRLLVAIAQKMVRAKS